MAELEYWGGVTVKNIKRISNVVINKATVRFVTLDFFFNKLGDLFVPISLYF